MRSGSTAVFMAAVMSSISSQIPKARTAGTLTVGFVPAHDDAKASRGVPEDVPNPRHLERREVTLTVGFAHARVPDGHAA
jgi:hypothetical protein